MNCCRNNCTYLAIIIGLIAGIVLGVLYAFGFVSTGIVFWVYLLVGILGILFSPIYVGASQKGGEKCFCRLRDLFFAGSVGAIILAFVGLVTAAFASTVTVAIVLGVATLFVVLELVSVVCIADCLCDN